MGGGGVDFLNPLHTFFKLESNFNFIMISISSYIDNCVVIVECTPHVLFFNVYLLLLFFFY